MGSHYCYRKTRFRTLKDDCQLQVQKLPVSAFKRNGMQDQEHSKLLGTANFLRRCPQDVSIECEDCPLPLKVSDPVKVPQYCNPLGACLLKKEPIEVTLADVLDD